MPGAYAHMTLVNLASERRWLKKLPKEVAKAIQHNFHFCELGSVSPDYPYLAVGDSGAAKWADSMHYDNTGAMIQAGIDYLRTLSGSDQDKALPWLLGYAAHVTTDVTIHPVVELKVGPYQGHEKEHRVCEMHQDSYIYQRLDLGDIGLGEHLDSGLARCAAGRDNGQLDPVIEKMWLFMLEGVYPAACRENAPDIQKWHRMFVKVVDNVGEEGGKLLPMARHVAVNAGLTYPDSVDVRDEFIRMLETPEGQKDYDEIFDRAIANVAQIWKVIAESVYQGSAEYQTLFGDWNLDTGRDENENFVFWS